MEILFIDAIPSDHLLIQSQNPIQTTDGEKYGIFTPDDHWEERLQTQLTWVNLEQNRSMYRGFDILPTQERKRICRKPKSSVSLLQDFNGDNDITLWDRLWCSEVKKLPAYERHVHLTLSKLKIFWTGRYGWQIVSWNRTHFHILTLSNTFCSHLHSTVH